jgi:hypothetical protein
VIEKKIENDGWQIYHERLKKKKLIDEFFHTFKVVTKVVTSNNQHHMK